MPGMQQGGGSVTRRGARLMPTLPLVALALLLLSACGWQGPHGVHADSSPSSVQLSICLAFPVNTNAISAFAAIGACSKLGPVLQSVYVTWNPTYCQFQAPSFVGTSGSQLGGGKMVVFTCWDAPDENRFSAQLFRLWGATFPNVNPRFRDSLLSGLDLPQLSLYVRTPPSLPTRSLRLPVGAAAAIGNWVLMQVDSVYMAAPPPPLSGGVTLSPPPAPPSPPRALICTEAELLLEVQGMQLCVLVDRRPLSFTESRCDMSLEYTLRNIGTTLFPDAGLSTKLSTTITNGTVTYLPIPGTRDPFTINITRFNNLRDTAVSITNLGQGMPRGRADQLIPIHIRMQITCTSPGSFSVNGMPPSCLCGALAVPSLPSGSAEVQCPKPFIQTRRGISRECFLPPGPTGRIQMISRVFGQCVFQAEFAVTNQGGSAVQSFYGPLNVDLSWAMGMLQLSSLPAVNAVVNATSGSSTFNITNFGGNLQPTETGYFMLPLVFVSGQCDTLTDQATARAFLSVIQFSAAAPPATTVQAVSVITGVSNITRDNALPFNDGDIMDSSARCTIPMAVLMDYNATASTSYFYVAYPYAYANLPSYHGAFSRNIDATTRFNAPPSSTATGDLTGYRVVAVRVYTANVTGRTDPYICGMDMWAVHVGTTSGQITQRPNFALGCSQYVTPRPTVPTSWIDLNAPAGSFLGWFTGADSNVANSVLRRVQSLQVVWVSCSPSTDTAAIG